MCSLVWRMILEIRNKNKIAKFWTMTFYGSVYFMCYVIYVSFNDFLRITTVVRLWFEIIILKLLCKSVHSLTFFYFLVQFQIININKISINNCLFLTFLYSMYSIFRSKIIEIIYPFKSTVIFLLLQLLDISELYVNK